MASPATDFPKKSFRVDLVYCFKKKPAWVLQGMTVQAFNEADAVERAIAKHIKPYPRRIYVQCHVVAA